MKTTPTPFIVTAIPLAASVAALLSSKTRARFAMYVACGLLMFLARSACAQTTIMNDQFQQTTGTNSAQYWQVIVDGASVTTPSSGLTSGSPNNYLNSSIVSVSQLPVVSIFNNYMALRLTFGSQGSPSGGVRQYVSPAYRVTISGTGRRLQIQVGIQLQNIAADDVSVGIEEFDSGNNSLGWLAGGLDFNNPSASPCNFVRIIPATNWRTYSKIGQLRDTTASVKVHFVVKNNANKTGILTVSQVAIFSSSDTSYLMDSYSGVQGNVISGTSGVVKVNLYDSRGPGGATFNVTDQNNAAVSPQPVISFDSTGTVATVALSGKGYYNIKVTPPSGTAASNVAALVDPAAPAIGSPFGMFSCDTSNLMEYTAGSAWGRFFLLTSDVFDTYNSGTDVMHSFTSRYENQCSAEAASLDVPVLSLLIPDSTIHQQWIACLGGAPSWLANTGSGTFNSGIFPPTDWTMWFHVVEYAISNLPPSVQKVEVMNEPEWDWMGVKAIPGASQYANINMMYKTVHDAVADLRSRGLLQNPNLKIIGPSFAHFYSPASNYNDGAVNMQNALFAGNQFSGDTGLLTYVDEISMHGYNDSVSNSNQMPEAQFYDRIVQWVNYERNTMKPPGLTTDGTPTGPLKPIYMTEYGWPLGTSTGSVSELTRADYVSRSMIISNALSSYNGTAGPIPFNAIMWFNLFNRSLAPWAMIDHVAYSPAPTYVAYTTTAKKLDDMDLSGPYQNIVPSKPTDVGGSYQMAGFENSSTLYSETCLWTSGTTGATLKMHIPYSVSFTEALDTMGRSVTITPNGTITLSSTPVFLRAWKFFAPTVTATITVTHGTVIPGVVPQDALCPSTFVVNTGNGTLTAPATPGTYNAMVKVGGNWNYYTFIVQ